jgi:hypothetical protein
MASRSASNANSRRQSEVQTVASRRGSSANATSREVQTLRDAAGLVPVQPATIAEENSGTIAEDDYCNSSSENSKNSNGQNVKYTYKDPQELDHDQKLSLLEKWKKRRQDRKKRKEEKKENYMTAGHKMTYGDFVYSYRG